VYDQAEAAGMSAGDCDVVVIGGGIHGAGVAQAAAACGRRVLLLERSGFAAGSSSRSSKLIHGGLRYLETGALRLVRESLAEREVLLRIAPALVRRQRFYIPVYDHTRRRPWRIRAGLMLYALLGGLKRAVRFETLARREWAALDGLDTRGLQAVFCYQDAQTDDAALTRAVLASARALGAELVCPAQFLSAARAGDGWRVRYRTPAGERECRARALINAAGPWANEVLANISPVPPRTAIELVQGAHCVLEGELSRGVYYVEACDGRAVFVMPWQGRILLGTTETAFHGDPAAVAPRPEEIEYLLETFARYFPGRPARVLESFAGLRVLPHGGGAHFRRSRETVLATDDDRRPRLVTIYGGKLTGYRATAARVLRRLAATLPPRRRCRDTARIPLPPADEI
jgi:glycerol-3-phosphate dehydrogenase